MTLRPFALYAKGVASTPVLIALLVCLIPTTIGGLLSAIGIAGMDRVLQHNVLAMSGRAVEAAGDVNVLLLDKTGTITLGNRQATEFFPAPHVLPGDLAEAAQLSSLSDETPEGRSIVVLSKDQFGLRARRMEGMQFIPFSAQTRMSGVDFNGRQIRKGAGDSVADWVRGAGRNDRPRRVRPAQQDLGRGRHAAPGRGRGPRARRRRACGTSSRPACGTASTGCGRWASRRS